MYTVSIKSKPNIFAITLKIVHRFPSDLVAAAINAEQCVSKLSTSPDVCTHTLPCNVTEAEL